MARVRVRERAKCAHEKKSPRIGSRGLSIRKLLWRIAHGPSPTAIVCRPTWMSRRTGKSQTASTNALLHPTPILGRVGFVAISLAEICRLPDGGPTLGSCSRTAAWIFWRRFSGGMNRFLADRPCFHRLRACLDRRAPDGVLFRLSSLERARAIYRRHALPPSARALGLCRLIGKRPDLVFSRSLGGHQPVIIGGPVAAGRAVAGQLGASCRGRRNQADLRPENSRGLATVARCRSASF
jgi:hypothetical protein